VDVEPWASLDSSSLKIVGLLPDIIKEIESRAEHRMKISLASLSFERINRELKSARKDCVVSVRDIKRDRFTILGESVVGLSLGVVAHKKVKLKKHDDLYSISIPVNKIWAEKGQFMDDDGLQVDLDVDYLVGLRKVRRERLDAIAGPIRKIQYLAKLNEMEDVLGEPLILSESSIYLQCSKKSKNIKCIRDVNEAIKAMKLDSTIARIVNENGY
jgi:hypothetical protein